MARALRSLLLLGLSCLSALVINPTASEGCPFCSGSLELTISQQIEDGVAAVIARQVSSRQPGGRTAYIVLDVLRTSPEFHVAPRETLLLTSYTDGEVGSIHLIIAGLTERGDILWGPPQSISPACRQYILQRPDMAWPRSSRLAYYANFLEHEDLDVAVDAWTEFASADFHDITPIVDRLPHDLLSSVVRSQLDRSRLLKSDEWLGLYGMLLGLCGGQQDAEVMQQLIVRPLANPNETRLGIDGVMGGYLYLTGEAGLALLESQILEVHRKNYSEWLAVRSACSFMWTYGEGRISESSLKRILRNYLSEPALAAVVLPDLARWRDWESIVLLNELSTHPEYMDETTQRQIIQFLLTAERADLTEQTATQESTEGSLQSPADTHFRNQCLELLKHYRSTRPQLVDASQAGQIQ